MSKLFSLFAPKETKDQKQFKLEREFSARGHQTDNIAKFIDDELDSLDKHTKVAMDVDGMDWHLEPVSPRRSNATSTPSMSPRIQSVPVSPRSAAESANYSANKTTSAEWLSELRYAHIVPNSPKMEPLKIEAPTVLKSVVRATTASGSEVDICPTVDAYLAQRAVVKSSGSLEGYRSTSVREIEESCRVQDTMWDPFNLTASQASDLQVISDQILNEQKNNVIAKLQLSASQRSIRPKSTILKDLKLDLSALNLDDAQTPTSPRSNDTPTSPRDAPINGNHLFEREGVHVSLLSKFIEFWGGKDVLNVAACAYVRDNLMKEATKETNLSFRDFWKPILIQEDSANARLFGPAKEYIVYHPNMQFLEFAETLQKRYESKSADTYLYIDMFCMNLNSPLANDFDTLTNTTRMITRSIPETVLVFHKSLTDESSVLSNPLTLYQMYYAAERKSYCDIALTIKARKAIFDNLFFRFDDIYKSILENKIEAYVKDSSPQSHALASFLNTLISNGEPLSLINSKVAYQFRGALIRFLKRALSDRPTEETEISLKVALGKCYKLDQAFAKAEPLFKVSYDVSVIKILYKYLVYFWTLTLIMINPVTTCLYLPIFTYLFSSFPLFISYYTLIFH